MVNFKDYREKKIWLKFIIETNNPTVKMEIENLTKIPTDPFSAFLGIIQKLILINSSKHPNLKNDFKKYCVDLFYNNLFLNKNVSTISLKSELHKVNIQKL